MMNVTEPVEMAAPQDIKIDPEEQNKETEESTPSKKKAVKASVFWTLSEGETRRRRPT